jgi:hypothetical protein
MAYTITETEYAEVDGVPLATTAWALENLYELWQPAETRGQDRILPGAAGVRPYRRRATVTRRTLNLSIWGDVDWDGVAYDDWRVGLMLNIDHLRTGIVDATVTGDGTRLLDLHMPDGDVRSARIHVEGMSLASLNWYAVRSTIDISLLSGVVA